VLRRDGGHHPKPTIYKPANSALTFYPIITTWALSMQFLDRYSAGLFDYLVRRTLPSPTYCTPKAPMEPGARLCFSAKAGRWRPPQLCGSPFPRSHSWTAPDSFGGRLGPNPLSDLATRSALRRFGRKDPQPRTYLAFSHSLAATWQPCGRAGLSFGGPSPALPTPPYGVGV